MKHCFILGLFMILAAVPFCCESEEGKAIDLEQLAKEEEDTRRAWIAYPGSENYAKHRAATAELLGALGSLANEYAKECDARSATPP